MNLAIEYKFPHLEDILTSRHLYIVFDKNSKRDIIHILKVLDRLGFRFLEGYRIYVPGKKNVLSRSIQEIIESNKSESLKLKLTTYRVFQNEICSESRYMYWDTKDPKHFRVSSCCVNPEEYFYHDGNIYNFR